MTRDPILSALIERECLHADLREARALHNPTRGIMARIKWLTETVLRGLLC